MTTPRFKKLVAELISGTAAKARDELCDYLHLAGYPDADKVLKAIEGLEEEHGEKS